MRKLFSQDVGCWCDVDLLETNSARWIKQTLQEIISSARLRLVYRIAVLNTAFNPFIYAVWYQYFRSGARAVFWSCWQTHTAG